MAQILVRNLDDASVERLKRRASKSGRSLQAEAKLILEQAAQLDMAAARQLADRLRAKVGRRSTSDSVEILRELRDG